MNVFFMRHGQTDYNAKKLINCDCKKMVLLNSAGKDEVKKTMRKLCGAKFDVVLCSEFVRTQQTASMVDRDQGAPIIIDYHLNEINIGLEGHPIAEYNLLRATSGVDEYDFKMEGQESFADLQKRVHEFLESLRREKYQDVLVVTHEAVILVAMVDMGLISKKECLKKSVRTAEYVDLSV